MKERVTTQLGTANVVLVAPHGHDLDDSHTGALTLAAATALKAHAIVNNDWRRAKAVDELKGLANCNNIDHCNEPVVKAEFYDPILDAINACQSNYDGVNDEVLVLMIHGIGNGVRNKAKDPKLDLIVGFGAGDKPRHTCHDWLRDLFIDHAEGVAKWKTYEGAPGGDYSARSSKNLTQAIHRSYHGSVNVLQLEFIYALRSDDAVAAATGKALADVVAACQKYTSYARPGNIKPPPQI